MKRKESPACGHDNTRTDLVTIKINGKKTRVCIVCAHNYREGIPITISGS